MAVRPLRAGFLLGTVVAVCGVVWACSSSPKLVAAGGDCFQATDCQEGLICAPDMSTAGKRSCTSDLTGIQKVPMMPAVDAGRRDAGDAASDAPMMLDTGPIPDSAVD